MPGKKRQKSKVYAVAKGRKCGIYNTWDECQTQVCSLSSVEYYFTYYIGSASFTSINCSCIYLLIKLASGAC